MNHHCRSAQVWHMFSRDLTVLPAHPHVHPQSEWAIPAFAFPDAAGTHFAVLFKGERLRDQPSPEMLTSKIFNTISAYLYSCRCQYCYHIKQKYCIFFPPKAFCDNQKVLKRLGELTTFPRPPVGWGGEHPFPIPTPRHLRHLDNGALFQWTPAEIFFSIRPWFTEK